MAEARVLACRIDEIPDHLWRPWPGSAAICATYYCYVTRDRHPAAPAPLQEGEGQ